MRELSIDIETFSSVPLGGMKSQGVYKYVEADDFDILMVTFGFDNEELVTIDLLSGEKLPQRFIDALTDPTWLKTAWNAAFEIQCLRQYLGIDLDPAQWCCTMIKAGMLGLPMKLDYVGTALSLEIVKDKLGSLCIKTFSEPCKPTLKNGMKTRMYPFDNPELWQAYLSYNRTDVVVEKAVRAKIAFFKVPAMERRLWVHDRLLNDIGIWLDIPFIEKAIEMRNVYQTKLRNETALLTGVENPGSNAQILKWLNERCGTNFVSLNKTEIPKIYEAVDDEIVNRVLENRAQYSKSSLSKFDKMLDIVCKDGRVHGIIQLYGANRTGRYCLAENTPVLVKDSVGNIFDKPIQDVALSDLVFDGDNWVSHEGVVFSGYKPVIEHDGVVATETHNVFISDTEKVSLLEAKIKNLKLWQGNIQFIN